MRTIHPAVAGYVAAVREELADLPADEVAEIAEDVREHLEQVASEFGDDVTLGQLIERLGAPTAYAAELRSAAGLPEPAAAGTTPGTGFGRRLFRFLVSFFTVVALGLGALSVLDAMLGLSGAPASLAVPALVIGVLAMAGAQLLVAGRDDPMAELHRLPGAPSLARIEQWMRSTPWGTPAIDVVHSLRPAWWVVRAGAVALIAGYLTGSVSTGVLVLLAALIGSVWLGLRGTAGRVNGRAHLAIQVANAGLAVGGLLVVADALNEESMAPHVEYVHGEYGPTEAVFYTSDLSQVTNLFAYDENGTLLENVRIYDQDGRPIDLGWFEECYRDAPADQPFLAANPSGHHAFPRLTVDINAHGVCGEPVVKPPLIDQLPGAADTPAGPAPAQTPAPEPLGTPAPEPLGTPAPAPVE